MVADSTYEKPVVVRSKKTFKAILVLKTNLDRVCRFVGAARYEESKSCYAGITLHGVDFYSQGSLHANETVIFHALFNHYLIKFDEYGHDIRMFLPVEFNHWFEAVL